jgi:uncharacterized protein (TIGR02466 family)
MITPLFPTLLYRAPVAGAGALNAALAQSCRALAAEDEAGRAWCKAHAYKGYTSYASLNDLPQRDPAFADLRKALEAHVARFAAALHYDMRGRRLKLDSMWANVLEPGGVHGLHLHPGSVISGTYYVEVPKNAAPIKFEDPRLAQMMAAPMKRDDAPEAQRLFVSVAPAAGEALLWESFLRHEVPPHGGRAARISVSFNYA